MEKETFLWPVAFTFIGALVGAGFASGQELLRFFAVFGQPGIIGAALSGLLFSFFGVLVIRMAAREEMEGYADLLRYLFGKRLALLFDGVTTVFLFLSLAIMLVAGSSLCQQLWGMPLWQGYLFLSTIVYLTLLADLKGVFWLNTLLIPGLILLTLAIAAYSLLSVGAFAVAGNSTASAANSNFVGQHWLWAVVLYVSYNFVLGAVVLSSLGRTASLGGKSGVALGGLILGLLAGIISLALFQQDRECLTAAMPMLVLAGRVHPWAGIAYAVGLWAAIITTALALGLGLLKRVQHLTKGGRAFCLILVFLPTLPFLFWSFPQMVTVIYPLMGYLGLLFLLAILRKAFFT
jgi:uncharacterized membrane protein YkvI